MALSKTILLGVLAPLAGIGVLAAQGLRVRRTALRLPEAAGPDREYAGQGGSPLNLYVIGDSVAAAVGLEHHDTALSGRLAQLLAASRPVRRTVLATSGFNAEEAKAQVEGRLSDADVVVVSIGVNDTKGLHSRRRWRADLTALLDSVTSQAPQARVILLGIPPMEVFPALPRALGLALGARARLMNGVAREVAAGYPTVTRVELSRGDFFLAEDPFARDGFHPSESSHAVFATRIHSLLEEDTHV